MSNFFFPPFFLFIYFLIFFFSFFFSDSVFSSRGRIWQEQHACTLIDLYAHIYMFKIEGFLESNGRRGKKKKKERKKYEERSFFTAWMRKELILKK